MKRKSVAGFIIGLIGLVVGIPIGYYAFWILTLLMGLSGMELLTYSVYLIPVSSILALIGICFYFGKAKLGAIIVLIASFLYLTPFVIALTIKGLNIGEVIIQLALGLLPAILLIITSILGFKSKLVE